MVCWPYQDGAFGARFDGPALSNAAGWDTRDTWPTLALLDLTGDGRAELLGRAPTGVDSWAWDGSGWGGAVNGPRLTASWAPEEHVSTLRAVAPPYRAPRQGGDTAVPDTASPDSGAGDSAGGDGADPEPSGDAAGVPGSLAPLTGGCGCAVTEAPASGGRCGGRQPPASTIFMALALLVSLVGFRRRARE
jgi:hypothetical protein